MRAPVAATDLVPDQTVACRRIRDAQQRLGETHERHALARIERELEHQRIDAACAAAALTYALRERRGEPLRGCEPVTAEIGFGKQRLERCHLVGAVHRVESLAQRTAHTRRGEEKWNGAHELPCCSVMASSVCSVIASSDLM